MADRTQNGNGSRGGPGVATTLSPSVIQQAVGGSSTNGAPQAKGIAIPGILDAWFGPQNPISPSAPEGTKGRTWAYTPGYNLLAGSKQRPLEPLSFSDLRMLARNLDLCALAIETRKDQMQTVEWEFRVKGQPKRSREKPDERIKILQDFFDYPDKDSGLDFKTWQRKANDDLLVIDQPCFQKIVDRKGRPYALRIIDGATMKLLVDANGNPPLKPAPRYQQWLYGVAVGDFTSDELLVRPRNPRPDKFFGYSPVEQCYVTLNIAIRKQLLNLNRYTEGTLPEAMVSCPPEWDTNMISQFQVYFDALLAGQYAQQSKLRFMPNGIDKAVFPKNFDNADLYDQFLAKIICYAFSLPSTWLTDKSNRATAEQAQDAALAEGLMPYLVYWTNTINYMIAWGWGWTDIECVPKMQKEMDVLKQAQAEDLRIRNGSLSVDEIREDLGESAIGQPPAVYVPAIGLVTIGDEGKDEAAEALANAPDPMAPPAAAKPATPKADTLKPKDDEVTPPDHAVTKRAAAIFGTPESRANEGGLAKAAKKKVAMMPMTGHQRAERHLSTQLTKFLAKEGRRLSAVLTKLAKDADDADDLTLDWTDLIPVFEPQIAAVAKRAGIQALAQVRVTDEGITDSVSDAAIAYAKERAGELVGMAWDGKEWVPNPNAEWAITDSTRDMLRATIKAGTEDGLSADALADKIRDSYAFSQERAQTIARTELASAHVQGNLEGWKQSGVVSKKESILSSGHDQDDECNDNADAGEIPIDADFPSGDDGPPYHPNCECDVVAIVEGDESDVED